MNMPPASAQAQVICLPLFAGQQVTATAADIAMLCPGFKGRVVGIVGIVTAIGGSTAPTDVDIMVEKGTTDLCSAVMAAVDSSAIVAGGAEGTLSTTAATLAFEATDVLHLDVTVTGGSSPTADGVGAYIFVVRE